MTPKGMSHVELTVRDLERSLHFYRDLLGFHVAKEGTERDLAGDGEYQQYQRGLFEQPDRPLRFAILHYGKANRGPYGMGEGVPSIVLITPLQTPPTGTSIQIDQVGITHIGFWVDELDTLCKELTSKGVTLAASPHILVKTSTGTIRSAYVRDPDGIILQFDELVRA